MEIEKKSNCIRTLMNKINECVNDLNKDGILYIENIIEYKYKDLFNIEKIIRECHRCNKKFIPKYNTRNTQIYCCDDCRYNSTQETRKVIKQDGRYKKIDRLRKLIYEKRYRANKENKPLKESIEQEYINILMDCRHLSTKRKHLTQYEFNKTYDELMRRYRIASKY